MLRQSNADCAHKGEMRRKWITKPGADSGDRYNWQFLHAESGFLKYSARFNPFM